ncbi:MAG: DNA polymerase Y family protein [Alphaproteobacteria bacterium]
MRRILSLWFPRFATDRLARKEPAWADKPLATYGAERNLPIRTANEAAAKLGVYAGQGLNDAYAGREALRAVPADAAGDQLELSLLADWCGRYTPWAAVDGNDGLFLDITGCAHLFGGEEKLREEIVTRLGRFGYGARAAVAPTPGAAWAFARFGTKRNAADTEAALAMAEFLPTAALRLTAQQAVALHQLGLNHVGDVMKVARAQLAPRFGTDVVARIAQFTGETFEPISPRVPADPDRAGRIFAEPIRAFGDIEATLKDLLQKLCDRLAEKGRGARRLDFSLYRIDGSVASITVGTGLPALDPRHLADLFAEKLQRLDPGLGADAASLSAVVTEPFGARQIRAAFNAGAAPVAATATVLAPLVDRLDNRLGRGAVVRLEPAESHVPERAVTRRPALAPAAAKTPWRDLPRPVRLFALPEPVDANAEEPDRAPIAFRWRQTEHRVARAEGPERIGGEWWRRDARGERDARDYYRVEDSAGQRFWLFREGQAAGRQAWFVHGLFA